MAKSILCVNKNTSLIHYSNPTGPGDKFVPGWDYALLTTNYKVLLSALVVGIGERMRDFADIVSVTFSLNLRARAQPN